MICVKRKLTRKYWIKKITNDKNHKDWKKATISFWNVSKNIIKKASN